jgi:hypothetical protein
VAFQSLRCGIREDQMWHFRWDKKREEKQCPSSYANLNLNLS